MRWDVLWQNVHLATMTGDGFGTVLDGALATAGDRIAWVGTRADLPAEASRRAAETRDGGGGWLTPGLVDCHTHLVYGGSRAGEWRQRLEGRSYEEIARAGGGILSTVRATRAASDDELLAHASRRLAALLAGGVTTVEIKSGYGLDRDTELRMLRVARRLGEAHDVTVRTTFLGLHTVPPEYRDRPDDYVALQCDEVLPAATGEGLVDAVDAFCECIAFSPVQTERVLAKATALGLPVKLHADQLSDLGGAALAARHRALSADHLEHTSEDGVRALASSGTVAVLLPGAYWFLRESRPPPIAKLRAHGVPIALATDCNPGSSPLESLLLAASMGCTAFGLTPAEALAGITREGARALGLHPSHGTLEVGKVADLCLWDVQDPVELVYRVGARPLLERIRGGRTAP